MATTMHCDPNCRAPSVISSGRCTAAVWIETLSAPARSKARISSTSRMPPPTVNGMKTSRAVRSTRSIKVARCCGAASMARKTSSSAPCSEYDRAMATGSPWSRSSRKWVPLTTRPPATSRQGMIRLSNMPYSKASELDEIFEQFQAGRSTALGMKLHGDHRSGRDGADEGDAVRGLRRDQLPVRWDTDVGVNEVHGLPFQAGQHRVVWHALQRVPADVGQLFLGGQALDSAAEDPKTRRAVFRVRGARPSRARRRPHRER